MATDMPPILAVVDLSVFFSSGMGRKKNTVKAVDGVSFQIETGETFGLVGESGCGKTTIGRAIIRLNKPTKGKIVVSGHDVSEELTAADRRFLTDTVAMIFQDPIDSLNPRMTIEEIVAEGLKVKGVRDKKERRKRVYEMLDRVGLTQEHATRYPHEFSGGQRQRVGIARALINNPKLIIADEPVSALDVSIRAQIINLLNDLKEELNISILFISHDLSLVKYFSDRIGVMYYGKIVEIAKGEDLYKKPIHPYTRSLLSAIPQANPIQEKHRQRFLYEPQLEHDYMTEEPALREFEPDHYVYCSEGEFLTYQQYLEPV